jgi:hypothetical protein
MDIKNKIIIGLIVGIGFILGLFFFNLKKQQDLEHLFRNMQYGSSNSKEDSSGKRKDPYKELAVGNSLRKKGREIQECYNVFLETNPEKTDGFVEIDWSILEDGTVKKAELVNTNFSTDSLNQCILKIISKIEFPPPPTGMQTYMTYKYIFKKDLGKESKKVIN